MTGGGGGMELDKILIQTAAGLERLLEGKFAEALRSFKEVVQHEEVENAFETVGASKHRLLYWVAPQDVSTYAAFLCLCYGSTTDMLSLADHVSALEWVPHLKQALLDFVHAKYQDCWNCVAVTLFPSLKVDPYLGPHLNFLLFTVIRRKILQNYWKAYSRVPLNVMAQDLGSSLVPSVDALRDEWITLILEQQSQQQRKKNQSPSLAGDLSRTRLDMSTDTLHRDPETNLETVQSAKLQRLTKTVLDDSYSMVIRLACQEHDLIVTTAGGDLSDAMWPGGRRNRKQGGGRRGGGGGVERMLLDDMDEDDDMDDEDAMNPEDLY